MAKIVASEVAVSTCGEFAARAGKELCRDQPWCTLWTKPILQAALSKGAAMSRLHLKALALLVMISWDMGGGFKRMALNAWSTQDTRIATTTGHRWDHRHHFPCGVTSNRRPQPT